MRPTAERLLELLTLFQQEDQWSAMDLAARLEVTDRTVRKDVERLRSLGYPIKSEPGVGGGYRLGSGTKLPPLLFNDEEAVATVVALRNAATTAIAGIEQTSLRALAKLQNVLPSKLIRRATVLADSLSVMSEYHPTVDATTLIILSSCCRDRLCVRFDYVAYDKVTSRRFVEPYQLVVHESRWYLFCWDLDRSDWRTFRVDRLKPLTNLGPRFEKRPLPADDLGTYLVERSETLLWKFRAEVIFAVPIEEARTRLPRYAGTLEAVNDNSCIYHSGSDSLENLALYLGMSGLPFRVVKPNELVQHIEALAQRYLAAVESSANAPHD